jgi:hypothetical protein
MAVGQVFRWAATEIEVSNRSIYTHSWVKADDFLGQDDPDLIISTPSVSENVTEGVNNWLEGCKQDTSNIDEVSLSRNFCNPVDVIRSFNK